MPPNMRKANLWKQFSREVKELLKLFEGSMSLNDLLNAPYSVIYSIRKRFEEDNKKAYEQRMQAEGGGGVSPPAMEQRKIDLY